MECSQVEGFRHVLISTSRDYLDRRVTVEEPDLPVIPSPSQEGLGMTGRLAQFAVIDNVPEKYH
jgi:hypothetical protein